MLFALRSLILDLPLFFYELFYTITCILIRYSSMFISGRFYTESPSRTVYIRLV